MPDHGVIVVVVVCGPQSDGLVRVARGPPLSWMTKEVKGTCGSPLKVVVSCAVAGSALTRPINLTETP